MTTCETQTVAEVGQKVPLERRGESGQNLSQLVYSTGVVLDTDGVLGSSSVYELPQNQPLYGSIRLLHGERQNEEAQCNQIQHLPASS